MAQHYIDHSLSPWPSLKEQIRQNRLLELRSAAFAGTVIIASLVPSGEFVLDAETYRTPSDCTIEEPATFNNGKNTGAEPSDPTRSEINTINWPNVLSTVSIITNEYHPVDDFIDKQTGLKFVIYSDGHSPSVDQQAISEYLNAPLQLADSYDNPSLRHKMLCTAEAVYKKGALKGQVVNIYLPSNPDLCFYNQSLVSSKESRCDIDAYSVARFSLVYGLADVDQSVIFALGDNSEITEEEQIEVGIHELAGHILDYIAGIYINGQENEAFAYYLTAQTLKEAEQAGLIFDPFLEYEFAEVKDQGGA